MTIQTFDDAVPRLTESKVTVIQALGIHYVHWPELKQRVQQGNVALPAPLLTLDCFIMESQDESEPATPDVGSPNRR